MNYYQVKPTQRLLVPKFYLFAALLWTGVVAYFCLANSASLPKMDRGIDKFGHFSFHFGIVLLWFLYFNFRKKEINLKTNLKNAFLMSFSYGILIEICQALFTKTRTAEFTDVMANVAGAIVAVLFTLIGLRISFLRHFLFSVQN
jgi:VanZ family protein